MRNKLPLVGGGQGREPLSEQDIIDIPTLSIIALVAIIVGLVAGCFAGWILGGG